MVFLRLHRVPYGQYYGCSPMPGTMKRVFCNVNKIREYYKTKYGGALSPPPDGEGCPCHMAGAKARRETAVSKHASYPPSPASPEERRGSQRECPPARKAGAATDICRKSFI